MNPMNSSSDQALAVLALALFAIGVKMMFRHYKTLRMHSAMRPQRLLSAGDEQRAQRSYQLAIELIRRNEFDAAAAYLNTAEEQLAASGIQNLQLFCAILNQQAICLLRSGKGTESEITEVVERSVKHAALSKKDKVLLDALFTRASVCKGLGRAEDAESCLRRCLELTEKLFGKYSEQEGRLLSNLGLMLFEQGRYGESLESFRLAVTILEKRTGRESSLSVQARQGQVQALKRIYG